MSDNKRMTEDIINVIMVENTPMEYTAIIDKVNELHGLNAHKVYTKFNVKLAKDDKAGWALLFVGEREESAEETTIRTAKEAAIKKRVEEAELQQYLKLHKKYGKKSEA